MGIFTDDPVVNRTRALDHLAGLIKTGNAAVGDQPKPSEMFKKIVTDNGLDLAAETAARGISSP